MAEYTSADWNPPLQNWPSLRDFEIWTLNSHGLFLIKMPYKTGVLQGIYHFILRGWFFFCHSAGNFIVCGRLGVCLGVRLGRRPNGFCHSAGNFIFCGCRVWCHLAKAFTITHTIKFPSEWQNPLRRRPRYTHTLGGLNYTLGGLNYTLGGLNYTLGGLNYTLGGLNYTLGGLNCTLEGLNCTLGGLNYTLGGLNYTLEGLNCTVNAQKKDHFDA